MTIKKLKNRNDYCFHCDLTKRKTLKEINDMEFFDEWGSAFVLLEDAILGEEIGVEYNLCVDKTTGEYRDCSAIYKVDYNKKNNCIETDYSKYIHYEIDFNNPNWKKKFENAMCKALIEFFEY